MSDPRSDPHERATFPTTRWSRVVAAGAPATPEARTALAELCAAYWYPIYVLIRKRGHPAEEARDLTQDYFARLLEKGTLATADRARGRFRAFLRTDCGYFLADRRDRDRAQKRGGGRTAVSFDALDAEGRYHAEPADDLTPERLFDRSWALTLLEGVLDRLATESAAAGRGAWFERLRVVLTEGTGAVPYARIAAELGTTEAAVQQAASRLRRRYRAALREEIAATLDEPDEAAIDDEVRALFAALGD
jgi:DNA-directed RNA polymerase specialized sigma24 family protein